MAEYRVKPGLTFGPFGEYKAGQKVTLDPKDAQPFMDKLIPLDDAPPVVTGPVNELGMQTEPLIQENTETQTEEIRLTDDAAPEAEKPAKKKAK
jgi:hypothetical protein